VEIHALAKRGWSISAIARHTGRDRKTVRAYLRGKRHKRKRPPSCLAGLAGALAAGWAASLQPRSRDRRARGSLPTRASPRARCRRFEAAGWQSCCSWTAVASRASRASRAPLPLTPGRSSADSTGEEARGRRGPGWLAPAHLSRDPLGVVAMRNPAGPKADCGDVAGRLLRRGAGDRGGRGAADRDPRSSTSPGGCGARCGTCGGAELPDRPTPCPWRGISTQRQLRINTPAARPVLRLGASLQPDGDGCRRAKPSS